MNLRLTNSFISVLLILIFFLFSSAECNKDTSEEGGDCNPMKGWTYTLEGDDFLSPDGYTIDPPLLQFYKSGPSGICTYENIKVNARFDLSSIPTNSINVRVLCELSSFTEYVVHVDNYMDTGLYYSDDHSIPINGLGEPGWVSFIIEITWNPVTPYTNSTDLFQFVLDHFETLDILCDYKEFKQ